MKKAKIIVIAIVCVCLLNGCENDHTKPEPKDKQSSMFVTIEEPLEYGHFIVYHKDTKVMYAVSYGQYNYGHFTLLVNPDGTPMIYEEGYKE